MRYFASLFGNRIQLYGHLFGFLTYFSLSLFEVNLCRKIPSLMVPICGKKYNQERFLRRQLEKYKDVGFFYHPVSEDGNDDCQMQLYCRCLEGTTMVRNNLTCSSK